MALSPVKEHYLFHLEETIGFFGDLCGREVTFEKGGEEARFLKKYVASLSFLDGEVGAPGKKERPIACKGAAIFPPELKALIERPLRRFFEVHTREISAIAKIFSRHLSFLSLTKELWGTKVRFKKTEINEPFYDFKRGKKRLYSCLMNGWIEIDSKGRFAQFQIIFEDPKHSPGSGAYKTVYPSANFLIKLRKKKEGRPMFFFPLASWGIKHRKLPLNYSQFSKVETLRAALIPSVAHEAYLAPVPVVKVATLDNQKGVDQPFLPHLLMYASIPIPKAHLSPLQQSATPPLLTRFESFDLMVEVLRLLSEIHAARMVHGDITPTNIYYKREKDRYLPVINDFDHCKILPQGNDFAEGHIKNSDYPYWDAYAQKEGKLSPLTDQKGWMMSLTQICLIQTLKSNQAFKLSGNKWSFLKNEWGNTLSLSLINQGLLKTGNYHFPKITEEIGKKSALNSPPLEVLKGLLQKYHEEGERQFLLEWYLTYSLFDKIQAFGEFEEKARAELAKGNNTPCFVPTETLLQEFISLQEELKSL